MTPENNLQEPVENEDASQSQVDDITADRMADLEAMQSQMRAVYGAFYDDRD